MRRAAVVLAVLFALAGCTSGDPKAAPKPSPTPSPPLSPTPSPSPSGLSSGLALGSSYKATDSTGYRLRITVFAYRPAAGSPNDGSTDVIDAIDAKVCLDGAKPGASASISRRPWRLIYADDTQVEADNTSGGSGQPRPEYPLSDQPIAVGQCIRGMIPFVVRRGSRPAAVEYSTDTLAPVRWKIGGR